MEENKTTDESLEEEISAEQTPQNEEAVQPEEHTEEMPEEIIEEVKKADDALPVEKSTEDFSEAEIATESDKKKKKEKKAKKEKKKKKHIFLKILGVLFLLFVLAGIGAGIYAWNYWNELLEGCPELDIEKRFDYSSYTAIYDKNGEQIAIYPGNENIDWVSYEDIPTDLINAFIAIEDQRYWEHPGVDFKRLAGAVYGQLTQTSDYGASTITQQLIKNTHLTRAKTYERKAQEINLALQLERELSKEEILEWYLNILFLGETNYGIKNAAEDYFGKELKDLSLREMACIAGLVQSPNVYNPRANLRNGDMSPTDKRTNNVLYKMNELGMITDEEYQAALKDTLTVKEHSDRFVLYDYPTYVEYAIEDVAVRILESEGTEVTSDSLAEMKIEIRNGGYQIYTAFDKEIQDTTQEAVYTFDKYPVTKNGSEAEVSVVIMDQHTGRVVAMIGGREESTTAEGFNRATDSLQAVGSSMKPVAVYAPAIEAGNYPGTTVKDYGEKIEGYNTEQGYPNGDTTNAMITMRRALEISHNVAAVRFLLEKTGIDFAYDLVIKEGFNPAHISPSPAGLALGASDVTTLEMTAAYACLANGGVYIEPHAFIKVLDRNGNVVFDDTEDVESERVYSESTAWLVTNMMETNMTNGYGKNARLSGIHSAGKTGTHEFKVISFGGYTPYYTSFLRISTDDYADFKNASSYYQSAALWKKYMQPIHEGMEDREIQEKTAEELGIKRIRVCTNSGELPRDGCPTAYEYVTEENAPTTRCSGHWYAMPEKTEEYGWWDEYGNFYYYDWVLEAYGIQQ